MLWEELDLLPERPVDTLVMPVDWEGKVVVERVGRVQEHLKEQGIQL